MAFLLPASPDRIEEPIPGLIVEWYAEDRVILYRPMMVRLQMMEDWAAHVVERMRQWPDGQPYLAIHDLSQPGVSLQYAALVDFDLNNAGVTLRGRMQVEDLLANRPALRGRVALNFNMSLSGQTNRTLINFLNREQQALRYRTFFGLPKCLEWLLRSTTDTEEMRGVDGRDLS